MAGDRANRAAWIDAPYADLVVRSAPCTPPGEHELVVRARAVAVNPLDVVKQDSGDLSYRWLRHPFVLGEDVAGEVVEVGPGVSRFRVGDRVLAYAVGMEKSRNRAAEGAFQERVVVLERLTAPLPDGWTFEEGAVLPLAVSTAASALFQHDQLALRHPAAGAAPTGQAVLVWGGSTSVGSNAVQLATAAGYEVVATASPAHHDLVRRLGAVEVVDRRSPTVVADIAAVLRGRSVAGVLAVGTGSAEPALAVALAVGAARVALASPSVSFSGLRQRRGRRRELLRVLSRLVSSNAALQLRSRLRGVRISYVWGSTLMGNEVGPMLFADFLPAALADGRYVAAPAPHVVGSGLEAVQPALDALRAGVSARKLVVTV